MSCEWRGNVLLVRFTGELDIPTVPSLLQQLEPYDLRRTALMIDISHVDLIDSSGLGLLVS